MKEDHSNKLFSTKKAIDANQLLSNSDKRQISVNFFAIFLCNQVCGSDFNVNTQIAPCVKRSTVTWNL